MKDITPQTGGNLAALHNPEVFTNIAKLVQEHCTKNKLVHNIHGKRFPAVEAWQFAGTLMGLYPVLLSVENLSSGDEYKYQATATLQTLEGRQVGGIATMICSNKESAKRRFDEYAICSMAQTRAIGKAYRLLIGWLFKAAGFEATPAEEMDFEHWESKQATAPPPPPPAPKVRSIESIKADINKITNIDALREYWGAVPKAERPDQFEPVMTKRADEIKELHVVSSWTVKGSKDKNYTVTYSKINGWACNCPQGAIGNHCKHQKQIQPIS